MLWNFIIGGVTGIYLSDVPADYDLHGSMFVTAHFHYTLMGAGLTGAIGALAYWFPKMTGRMLDQRRRVRLVLDGPDRLQRHVPRHVRRRAGRAAAPGRALRQRLRRRQPGLDASAPTSSASACWCCSTPWSAPGATARSRRPTRGARKTLEWTVPNPIPLENFEVLPVVIADPYGYGEGDPSMLHTEQERQVAVASSDEKVAAAADGEGS